VDPRIVAATNRTLEDEIRAGNFRKDLFFRIAVVPIHLPPLRQRTDEIPLLVKHFIDRYNRSLELAIEGVEPEAMKMLLEYPFTGNVRELENVIERAMVLADGARLGLEDLPHHVRSPVRALEDVDLGDDELSVKKHGAILERRLIQKALERTGGNRTKAAELLDLSARALLYKIRDYELE
jgi:two-component system, NtrC family, response regulator AtoC